LKLNKVIETVTALALVTGIGATGITAYASNTIHSEYCYIHYSNNKKSQS